jgi:hypothetical protein
VSHVPDKGAGEGCEGYIPLICKLFVLIAGMVVSVLPANIASAQPVGGVYSANIHVEIFCWSGHIKLDGILNDWAHPFWSSLDLPKDNAPECSQAGVGNRFYDTFIVPNNLNVGKNEIALVVLPQPESINAYDIDFGIFDGDTIIYRTRKIWNDGISQPRPFDFTVNTINESLDDSSMHARAACYFGHIRIDGIVNDWSNLFWSDVDLIAPKGFGCRNNYKDIDIEDTYLKNLRVASNNQVALVIRPQPEAVSYFHITAEILNGDKVLYRASVSPTEAQPRPFNFTIK